MTTCIKCHRPLSDPESVKLGIGPICRSKESHDDGDDGEHAISPLPPNYEYQGDTMRVWRCLDGRVEASVPLSVIQHSPTGWECGYGGSGPADLALNIMAALVPFDELERVKCFRGSVSASAWTRHQDFKWAFIAPLELKPGEGHEFVTGELRRWLAPAAP